MATFSLRRPVFRFVIFFAGLSIFIGFQHHISQIAIDIPGASVLAVIQKRQIETTNNGKQESGRHLPTISNSLPEPISNGKATLRDTAKSPKTAAKLKSKVERQTSWQTSLSEALAEKIKSYHKDAERRCLEDYANDSHPPGYYCPCLPTEFNGRLRVSNSKHWNWSDIFSVTGDGWKTGGEWQPADCVARYHMAVIIPCRDRDYHLKALLRHLIPILRRQFLHFRIFVVEQHSPAVFNKASMMNIGFLEASKLFPEMNCVMFQDADTLAEDDRLLMRCDSRPHHYALTVSRYGYKMRYDGQFGGVVTIRPEMFRRINGYPIIYFGWGKEDDDMGLRVQRLYRRFRPPIELCRFTTLMHSRDSSNPKNRERFSLLRQNNMKYKNNTFHGMQEMSYTIRSIQRRSFYTYIHANINVTNLPYRKHAEYSYTEFDGVCPERFYRRSTELSMSTCRYLCDTAPQHQPCYGYTYYVIPLEDARLGTTVSECRFLIENCTPTRGKRIAFTYIRKHTTTTDNNIS